MKCLSVLAALLFALPAIADSVPFTVSVVDRVLYNPYQQVQIQLTPNGNPLVHSIDPGGTSISFWVANIFSSTFDLQTFMTLTLRRSDRMEWPAGRRNHLS
jgi:hypothetical protein